MSENLEKALMLHQSGRLEEAEKIYRAILKTDQNNDNVLRLLGLIENRKGRKKVAQKLIRKAISLNRSIPAYYNNLGEVLRSEGNLPEAIENYEKAIALNQEYAEAYNNLGNAFYQQGRILEAAEKYNSALHINPKYADALFNLGILHSNQGNNNSAIESLQHAIALDPAHENARLALVDIFRKKKEYATAEKICRETISMNPRSIDAFLALGKIHTDQGSLNDATALFVQALEIDPENSEAFTNLGSVYNAKGEIQKAISCFENAIELNPNNVTAYNELGLAQNYLGQYDGAIASFSKALALAPGLEKSYVYTAESLLGQGKVGDAISILEELLERNPLFSDARVVLGTALEECGERKKAAAAYRKALDLDPESSIAHCRLSLITKHREYDDHMKAMEAIYNRETASFEQQMHVAFGLGKAFDDLGDYAKAFEYIRAGNELYKRFSAYSFLRDADIVRQIQSVFSPGFMGQQRSTGTEGNSAIFIVGLSRAGKTLTETILSHHPLIEAGGEIKELHRLVRSKLIDTTGKGYPGCLKALDILPFDEIAEEYIGYLKSRDITGSYVINTYPGNSKYIGLIFASMPRAKVIECRRNPRDNCLEIYMKAYAEGNDYSHDLRAIGKYYCLQKRLMEHWKRLFPNRIYTVWFEDLIENPATEARNVLDYCQIDRESAYLEQLFSRESLHGVLPDPKETTNRWRLYEEHLQPLFEELTECEE